MQLAKRDLHVRLWHACAQTNRSDALIEVGEFITNCLRRYGLPLFTFGAICGYVLQTMQCGIELFCRGRVAGNV